MPQLRVPFLGDASAPYCVLLENSDNESEDHARGRFEAKAVVGETVPPGTVVSFGVWWSKVTGGPNVNATTATALTDLGGGGTFFDNLVEVM